jgi:hypothetical protein
MCDWGRLLLLLHENRSPERPLVGQAWWTTANSSMPRWIECCACGQLHYTIYGGRGGHSVHWGGVRSGRLGTRRRDALITDMGVVPSPQRCTALAAAGGGSGGELTWSSAQLSCPRLHSALTPVPDSASACLPAQPPLLHPPCTRRPSHAPALTVAQHPPPPRA